MFFKKLLSSRLTKKNLNKALQIAQEKREKSAFVFDVDSTLFCMKYRTQAILEKTFQEDFISKNFPEHLKKLTSIQVKATDWSVKEIMSRYGVSEEKLIKKIELIWKKKFFSNDYLHLDQPYEGAIEFLRELSQTSAHIYYLTARHWDKMSKGTFETLKRYNLPLKQKSHLIMKTAFHTQDAEYKTKHLAVLSKQFNTLCFFENEPVILNQTAKSLPNIHLFWMNSTHSGKESSPKKALTLSMVYSF